MSLMAGVAQVNITPPIGVWLTGYGHRTAPSNSIHSELCAQALVLEADGQKVAIVGMDVIALDGDLLARTQELVHDWTGIAADHLLLNAAHVHAGPQISKALMGSIFERDEAYCDILARKVATVVKLANDRLQSATLRFGSDDVSIGINRRMKRADGTMVIGQNPQGPVDPTVSVLRVDGSDGRPVAVVFAYACHPVIFNGLEMSSDYVGYARRTVENALDTPLIPIFLQGCGADINPQGDWQEPCAQRAERLGRMLGMAAAKAALTATPLEASPLAATSAQVALPLDSLPPLAEAERILAEERLRLQEAETAGDLKLINRGRTWSAWAERLVTAAAGGPIEHPPIAVQILRLGDLAIVGLGGEVLIEVGRAIRERSPFAKTIVLAYSNGCIGYVPPASAYPEGGYEVEQAFKWYGNTLMLAPDSERTLVEACAELLHRQERDGAGVGVAVG